MYYYSKPKSSKFYVSTEPITKANEFNYPWKVILRFTNLEYWRAFERQLNSNGIFIGEVISTTYQEPLANFHWYDMPEFTFEGQENQFEAELSLHYRIEDEEEVMSILPEEKLRKLKSPGTPIKKGPYEKTHKKYCLTYEVPGIPEWRQNILNMEYECDNTIQVKYPIYVISLSRFNSNQHLTISWLEQSQIPYYLVVEPQEAEKYNIALSRLQGYGTLLITPEQFHLQKRGGIPVRNFVYQHSKQNGDRRHWILDDNIRKYERRNLSVKKTVYGGAVFRHIEEYVDRFSNVRIAGHNYSSFSPPKQVRDPVVYTRAFSSILVSNEFDDEELWKGTYNEDLDLSIREWIAGRPVMLFNHMVCDKIKTGVIRGGNQVDIYAEENWQYKKAKEIVDRYKHLNDEGGIKIGYANNRFGRAIHHEFKVLRPRVPILNPNEIENEVMINEWGMTLRNRQ